MDYSNEPSGVFLLIDNKSFYATVECLMRGLDPLTTPLVVMSEAANTGGGLVMAASSMAKKLFHISNVNRKRDIPNDEQLIVVPPRMNLYIEKNLEVNHIFNQYCADEDLQPYSIDESILDITHSWKLFGNNILQVIRKIQSQVKDELGLVTTVGLGNNPLQAKIALDIYAKHNREFIGVITNQTVKSKIWTIPEITDVWGINKRTKANLARLGIHNMYELAHYNPFELKRRLGIIGTQLYATAWGIDRTNLQSTILHKDKSLGNSQVLPRDYAEKDEIETVIKEIGAQVAARLRAHNKQCSGIYLAIGYSLGVVDSNGKAGFAHSMKLSNSTAETTTINRQLIFIFEKYWESQTPVRTVAVSCTRLLERYGEQLNIFNTPKPTAIKLEETMDRIRKRYGKTAIIRASSLKKGGTFIERAGLVGGHNGGQSLE
ncbi:Y-family DNA polymerase [Limosilactobacillus vaginalis]|uniref:Y-family DNA polymerase n=1 Tax=Limosilactobacillus vaginalis TaxID=1633 RepID=UPI0024300363|nr:Y-family DNA polymerase [Limosilactobacillus vaginalis]